MNYKYMLGYKLSDFINNSKNIAEKIQNGEIDGKDFLIINGFAWYCPYIPVIIV